MNYKLLALDLDGTALGGDPDLFAPGLAEAAAGAAAGGCTVVVATGRPAACLPAAMDPMPDWVGWLILCDGAEIQDARTSACLWRRAFSAASLACVEQAAARWDLPVEYIDRSSCYHLTAAARRWVEASGPSAFHKNVVARHGRLLDAPAASLAGLDVLKINMPFVPQELRPGFAAAVGDAALILDCGPGGLELTAPGAGKLAAVQVLVRTLGLGMKDVMALGDSGNDAALLQAAGLGVAMGNGQAEVLAAAHTVTGRNTEGGAADAIRQFLLNG